MKSLASLAVLALTFAGNAAAQPQFGRPPGIGPPSRGPPSRPTTTHKVASSSSTGGTRAATSAGTKTSSSGTASSTNAGPSVPVVVQSPAANPGTCNTAADRTKWCNGFTVSTDAYSTWPSTGNTCSYNFVITNTTVNFDGTLQPALAINGQVPGPTIECQWGDTVSVTVTNSLTNNGTSIHWHGNRQFLTGFADGVAGVTECPLAPGQTNTYTWTATQYGTSWYHSHYSTQYADGIRGPIIIHGPASANYDVDMGPVMVEDL
jgi:laccase